MAKQDAPLKLQIHNIISKYTDKMFEAFDNLMVPTVSVYEALKAEGEGDLAEQYEEWVGAPHGTLDPEYDPTPQGEELVTDRADSPSYATLRFGDNDLEWPQR